MKYLVNNSFVITLILAVFLFLGIPMYLSWKTIEGQVISDMQETTKRELSVLSSLFIREANISKEKSLLLLDSFASEYLRITIISDDGIVLYDSQIIDEELEEIGNHADRQEVMSAQRFGVASSMRHSDTLNDQLVYVAETIPTTEFFPAGVLRFAVPSAHRLSYIDDLMKHFFTILGVFSFFTFCIAVTQNNRLKLAIEQISHVINNTAIDTAPSPALPQKPEFKELSYNVAQMSERVEARLKTSLSQQSELESILNSLQAGVIVLDTNDTVIKINPAIQYLLPDFFYNGTEEVIGKKTIEIFNNSDFEEAIKNIKNSDKSIYNTEIHFADKIFEVDITKTDPSSSIKLDHAMVIVLHDITQIVQLIEIKRDLVANVSHELRTPLTAIQGYAETLQEITKTYSNLIPDAERFSTIILKNVKHLDCIVTDLITFSSIENIKEIDKNVHTNLCEAYDIAISECQILIEQKNIEIVNMLELDTELKIDKDRLAQVLRNLLENACRYSPDDSHIALKSEILPMANNLNLCQICVQDYGRGIPQSELNRVFERFYRVEKHRSSASSSSTGLGLALCKQIVESYEGNIHAFYHAPSLIDGHTHVGATIRFTLPLHEKS